ncbi:alcohol dehydrogenase catalytic domain-containing protein [Variovorax sp. MHTC-1]|uniref:alcohol dehydrogenase catalytic domain-containing protein n=1 Tax=Variovorax sp. MHTC-1 TaxID=2495593 RepID=UPI0039185ED3
MPNLKILGVEGAGRVLAVGEGVDGSDIGQRMAGSTPGRCRQGPRRHGKPRDHRQAAADAVMPEPA